MTWPTNVGQPLAPTRAEAQALLEVELRRALPDGWNLSQDAQPERGNDQLQPLAWRIESAARNGKCYYVELPRSLEFIIFRYGNSDAGPLSLSHMMQKALVVEAAVLRHY